MDCQSESRFNNRKWCQEPVEYVCAIPGEEDNPYAPKYYFCAYHASHSIYKVVEDLKMPQATRMRKAK